MSQPTHSHPLDVPGSLKILLGREASEAIAANGDFHLAVITHPDATSPASADGRLVLICVPCTKDQLNAAHRVAAGKARAMKIKPMASAPPTSSQGEEFPKASHAHAREPDKTCDSNQFSR